MPRPRIHPLRKGSTNLSRQDRYKCYGIKILKLDNPGAGTQFYVADGGRLVPTPEAAISMSQADAKSLLLSSPLHKLLLSLDGVMESQVMKLW